MVKYRSHLNTVPRDDLIHEYGSHRKTNLYLHLFMPSLYHLSFILINYLSFLSKN